jgi:maltooligosyltrehalose synthase
LFVGAAYTPLRGNQHVAAFARSCDGQTLVVAAAVQIATLLRGALAVPVGRDVWRDQRLAVPGEPGRIYRDLFTGEELTVDGGGIQLAAIFDGLPVAALLAE